MNRSKQPPGSEISAVGGASFRCDHEGPGETFQGEERERKQCPHCSRNQKEKH